MSTSISLLLLACSAFATQDEFVNFETPQEHPIASTPDVDACS